MTLLAERMPSVRSAAFNFLIPAGGANDPPGREGLASIVCDLITRGAGTRDSREFSDALDNLGVDRGESAGTINVQLSGATLARNLLPTLALYADMLRRPRLPDDELEPAQAMSIQDLQSLEDDPQRKVMVELRKRYYPDPLGRDQRGTLEGVEAITMEDVRQFYQRLYQPKDAILAIAGDIDWPAVRDTVDALFADWPSQTQAPIRVSEHVRESAHVAKELEQTQIAFAFPSIPISDPDFYNARGAVGVLSLDMSSRLFSNVREKHGLCYSVWASYETFKDRGAIIGYAGAKPELAQETLDRTMYEIRNLVHGIEAEELDRVKIGLKSSLIMRQESTNSRTGSLVSDWYYLGRIRSLGEVQQAIEAVSVPGILSYLERYPANDCTLVTLGNAPLTMPPA